MGATGLLKRHLDQDLIERLLNGVPKIVPLKRQKKPKPSVLYRAARRNRGRDHGLKWDGIPPTKHVVYPAFKPNRAQTLDRPGQGS